MPYPVSRILEESRYLTLYEGIKLFLSTYQLMLAQYISASYVVISSGIILLSA